MLTAEQVEHFKTHGFVRVPGVIEPVYLQEWRRQFWSFLGAEEGDPTTWHKKPYVMSEFVIQPAELRVDQHPRVRAILQQLGGGHFVGGGGGTPLVHWPRPDTAWSPTRWGHLDGYYPGSWGPFMLAATTYLYDCEPFGGAFQYWPDSHLSSHRHFLEHPEQVDGRFRDEHGFDWGGPNIFTKLAPRPPEHFYGNAGDVLFWHAYLVHTGSANIRAMPRAAFIARWRHRDQDRFRYEIPENLWKYWAV